MTRRGLAAVVALSAATAGARPAWHTIGPADFAAERPAAEPEAPAVALEWRIDVDDREFPRDRKSTEYIRYKIFDPEKAVNLTRLSEFVASYNGYEVSVGDIRARLTLPGGATHEFGRESIRERSVVRSAESGFARFFSNEGTTVSERYLAITGIVPGAILEVVLTNALHFQGSLHIQPLQKSVPVLSLSYTDALPDGDTYYSREFLCNGSIGQARLTGDKRHVVVTAANIPSERNEPYSLPPLDRNLTCVLSVEARNWMYLARNIHQALELHSADGPWAPTATREAMEGEDQAFNPASYRALVAQITAGAATQTERAARLHKYVAALYGRFQRSRKTDRAPFAYTATELSHVLEFERYPRDTMWARDFVILEIALLRAAGLQADELMVADRGVKHFDPRLVCDGFLPGRLVRVQVDGQWRFSCPTATHALGFGQLPWNFQGEPALVARVGAQQFDHTPAGRPEDSILRNAGEFTLAPDGALDGDGSQTFTGQMAISARAGLLNRPAERRLPAETDRLKTLFGPDSEPLARAIEGLDDPAAPLLVRFHLHLPGYAVVTKHRLIFKPAIFRLQSSSPFTNAERHNVVYFRFPHQEVDQCRLTLPGAGQLEDAASPQSFDGRQLSYRVQIANSGPHHWIDYHREFRVDLEAVPASLYAPLKLRYDVVARGDNHELVFLRP